MLCLIQTHNCLNIPKNYNAKPMFVTIGNSQKRLYVQLPERPKAMTNVHMCSKMKGQMLW